MPIGVLRSASHPLNEGVELSLGRIHGPSPEDSSEAGNREGMTKVMGDLETPRLRCGQKFGKSTKQINE